MSVVHSIYESTLCPFSLDTPPNLYEWGLGLDLIPRALSFLEGISENYTIITHQTSA